MKYSFLLMLTFVAVGSACMAGGWKYGTSYEEYEAFGSPGGMRMSSGMGIGPGIIGLGSLGILLSVLFANHHPNIVHYHHHHYYQEKPGGGHEYKYSSQNPPGGGPYKQGPAGNPKPGGYSNFFRHMFYK